MPQPGVLNLEDTRQNPVADPSENLTGALHSRFGRGGCGGRG